MRIKVAGLALPLVIGIGVAVTACGGTPATTKSPASASRSASAAATTTVTPAATALGRAAAVPAGYARIGGPAQGISVAAPKSWVAINPTKDAIQRVSKEFHLKGISASSVAQDVEAVEQEHGIIVIDIKTAMENSRGFAPNLNAYCGDSSVTETGAAGVPFVKEAAAAEFGQVDAAHIAQTELPVGGVPGVETSYQLTSSSVGTVYGSQLEVLPKPGRICIVTVTTGDPHDGGNVISVAAATAQFP